MMTGPHGHAQWREEVHLRILPEDFQQEEHAQQSQATSHRYMDTDSLLQHAVTSFHLYFMFQVRSPSSAPLLAVG